MLKFQYIVMAETIIEYFTVYAKKSKTILLRYLGQKELGKC